MEYNIIFSKEIEDISQEIDLDNVSEKIISTVGNINYSLLYISLQLTNPIEKEYIFNIFPTNSIRDIDNMNKNTNGMAPFILFYNN